MADHLDQLSNDDLPPEAVERQACLQNFSQQRLDLIQNIDPQQRANFLLDNAGSAPLHFETVTSLGELSESDASVLLEYDVFSENDVVSQLNITYEDLPASVLALVPNELGGMPPVMVIGSENMDLPSIGMHVEPSNDGPLYYKDANGIITDVTVDNRGVILLNVSNNNKSLLRLPSDRVEEIIFNEYGHRITEEVREQFELAYAQQLVGHPFSDAPSEADVSAALLEDFSDEGLPRDDFSYAEINELTSDAVSLTGQPDSAESLIIRLSDLTLSTTNYQLSRDLYLQSLNDFRTNNNKDVFSSSFMESKLARLSEIHALLEESTCPPDERGNLQAEKDELLELFGTQDSEFRSYLRARFGTVTRNFYSHVLNAANAMH